MYISSGGIIAGIVAVTLAWIAVILLSLWLLRQPFKRQERLAGIVERYWSWNVFEGKNAGGPARRWTVDFLLASTVVSDFVMAAVFVIIGWWYFEGSTGDSTGRLMVYIIAPIIAMFGYAFAVIWYIYRKSVRRREREELLGRVAKQPSTDHNPEQ
jgi:Kef-type K+ transport system membrane component KefB